MARCKRCNRFMLFKPISGYCKECEKITENRILEQKIEKSVQYTENGNIVREHNQGNRNTYDREVVRETEECGSAEKICSLSMENPTPRRRRRQLDALTNEVRKDDGENSALGGIQRLLSSEGFRLSDEQSSIVLELEKSKNNFFITGKAGTGKSVILRYFREHTRKRYAVLAPTGIAAINVEGETIHSFFGLSTQIQNTADESAVARGLEKLSQKLRAVDTIIIDEISMVRVDVMDMIDAKLRVAKQVDVPFGGCQIIAFGDLMQLPPVVERDEDAQTFLSEKYHTYYFFGAPAVTESGFIIRELSQVFRQKDEEFIHMLNQIRIGNNSRSIVNSLNQQCEKILLDKECLTITPSNKDAARINQERLSALISQEYIYRGRIEGQYKKEELPTEMMLKLKVGAQVMFLVNDKQKRWVNGTIGTVAHLTPDLIQVKVKNGTYSVNMHVWNKYRYQYDRRKNS